MSSRTRDDSQTMATVTPSPNGTGEHVRDSEAEYALEYPAVCPSCRETIKTVRAIRLLRTRVNFTSTLPRHGRAVICPLCRVVLNAALTIS
jgi:hypothetical protein